MPSHNDKKRSLVENEPLKTGVLSGKEIRLVRRLQNI